MQRIQGGGGRPSCRNDLRLAATGNLVCPEFSGICTVSRLVRPQLPAYDGAMNASIKSLGIDRLGVEERLALVEEIWDSIAADNAALPLTDAQRLELERRIEEDTANPSATRPWSEIKAATLDRLKK